MHREIDAAEIKGSRSEGFVDALRLTQVWSQEGVKNLPSFDKQSNTNLEQKGALPDSSALLAVLNAAENKGAKTHELPGDVIRYDPTNDKMPKWEPPTSEMPTGGFFPKLPQDTQKAEDEIPHGGGLHIDESPSVQDAIKHLKWQMQVDQMFDDILKNMDNNNQYVLRD